MTNFDFLRSDPQFASFAEVAVSAERILHIDPAACALNCRRAMEFAVKWLYSVDDSLDMPEGDDRLARLMDSREFRRLVGQDLWRKMKLIRSLGNNAAHDGDKISREQAGLCLENLFDFMDFIAYCYGTNRSSRKFDPSLLDSEDEEEAEAESAEMALERLMAENAALRAQLTARREEHSRSYVPRSLELSEYNTRKIYIEAMLLDAGWTPGSDCLQDVALPGASAGSGLGTADYILYGRENQPLAIIETRRSCVDISKGRHQAGLCAELLEKQYGRRPVIFLTDGFDIYINDGSERRIAALYSRRDLERRLTLSSQSLESAAPDANIADREYQQAALQAVCRDFSTGQRRALLAMASGTGKTRTAAALCELMLRLGRAENILYLAERSTLATQAMRSFSELLPGLAAANLCCDDCGGSAPLIFATWEDMADSIDSLEDEQGKIFTCGHFDLVICDEAHGSALERHRDVFNYFDAPMLALTAAPTEVIDASVYELFGISGAPTYSYDMSQAIRDGYLVDYRVAEARLKFIRRGISYAELSPEDKAEYEQAFASSGRGAPAGISPAAFNRWIVNEDTIREALNVVMKNAIYVKRGKKIGKTIIFAASRTQANMIFHVFRKLYPRLTGYAKIVAPYTRDAQAIIDRFSDPKRLPQIVISVDELDSGIDLPQLVNLVFLKKVSDKARFWQMIGRGARPCPGLMDGADKDKFHIFDFCGNFEYFRMKKDAGQLPLPGEIFTLKSRLVCALQEPEHQTAELQALRSELVTELVAAVNALNRESFAVRQHLRYVEFYSEAEHYSPLTKDDAALMARELAPLISPDEDEHVLQLHRLIYRAELALLEGREDDAALLPLKKLVPQSEGISVTGLEARRRALVSNAPAAPLTTDFDDEVLSVEWYDSGLQARQKH